MKISLILEELAAGAIGIVAWFEDTDSLAPIKSSRVNWNVPSDADL
jgi:hypothetical protein